MAGAPHLTGRDIEKAIWLLEGWTGKLTWKIFLATLATELEHGHIYSKVAMLKRPKIKAAWKMAHNRLAQEAKDVGERRYGTSAVAVLRRRLDEVRLELAAAKALNEELLEQFERWQFNAERFGVKLTHLDAPQPRPQKAAK